MGDRSYVVASTGYSSDESGANDDDDDAGEMHRFTKSPPNFNRRRKYFPRSSSRTASITKKPSSAMSSSSSSASSLSLTDLHARTLPIPAAVMAMTAMPSVAPLAPSARRSDNDDQEPDDDDDDDPDDRDPDEEGNRADDPNDFDGATHSNDAGQRHPHQRPRRVPVVPPAARSHSPSALPKAPRPLSANAAGIPGSVSASPSLSPPSQKTPGGSSPWLAPSISSVESFHAFPRALAPRSVTDDSASDFDDTEPSEVADYPNFDTKERQKFIHRKMPFGFRLWKAPAYILERSELTQFGPDCDVCRPPVSSRKYASWQTEIGQVAWLMAFGWWLAMIHALVGGVLWISLLSRSHATVCLNVAWYLAWPFGKYLEEVDSLDDQLPLTTLIPRTEYDLSTPSSRRGSEATLPLPNTVDSKGGRAFYYLLLAAVLIPSHVVAGSLAWMTIIFIPVTKALVLLSSHLVKHPLKVAVRNSSHPLRGSVIVNLRHVTNWKYVGCQFVGVALVVWNLCPVVLISLADLYILAPINSKHGLGPVASLFFLLVSLLPLSCLAKSAVSTLSLQSSLGAAVVIDAVFGPAPEVIFFFIALTKQEPSLAVNLLTALLVTSWVLLPGLGLVIAGLRRRETPLPPRPFATPLVLIITAFFFLVVPTVVLTLSSWICDCEAQGASSPCSYCTKQEEDLFQQKLRPFLYFISVSSILLYLLGIVYSLKTTLRMSFETNFQALQKKLTAGDIVLLEKKERSRPDSAAQWSRPVAVVVLFVSLGLLGLLFHKLVEILAGAQSVFGLSSACVAFPAALFVSSSELYNVVVSAAKRDPAFASESISHYLVQILFIQIPLVTVVSGVLGSLYDTMDMFFAVFSIWDVVVLFIAVVSFSFSRLDLHGNYFQGASLVLCWVLLSFSYWVVPASLTMEFSALRTK